jgi:hypothetical protein
LVCYLQKNVSVTGLVERAKASEVLATQEYFCRLFAGHGEAIWPRLIGRRHLAFIQLTWGDRVANAGAE